MDAPQGNGLYVMTIEALNSMPRSDAKYFSGHQHGGVTESPDSLDGRLNEGFSFVTERSLLPHPQVKIAVGTPVHADGRTKYMVHRVNDGEKAHYLPGISTQQKARIAERDVALKFLVAGYSVDTEVIKRADKSYEVHVNIQTLSGRSPSEFEKAVSRILSGIGIENLNNNPSIKAAGNGHSNFNEGALSLDDAEPITPEYLHLMRHRSRAGFTVEDVMFSHRGKRPKTPSSEVYDRQFWIAKQIASAMNFAKESKDDYYRRAARLLSNLELDVRRHGHQLFGDNRLAKYFIGAVSEALVNARIVQVVPYTQGGTIFYKIQPRGI